MNFIARGITAKGVFIITKPLLYIYLLRFIQHLLRQGREAVIVAHELDVVSSEISEEAPTLAGDMVRRTVNETIVGFLIKSWLFSPALFVSLLGGGGGGLAQKHYKNQTQTQFQKMLLKVK